MKRNAKGQFVSARNPAFPTSGVPMVRASALPQPPTLKSSWSHFAFLIVVAVALYYAKWPILVIAALVGICKGWGWLSLRYPRTMRIVAILLSGFISGLLGGRRRRRW